MTQAAIDAVFADERYRSKFTSPQRDKAICEERPAGAMWKVIAKKHEKYDFLCYNTTYLCTNAGVMTWLMHTACFV